VANSRSHLYLHSTGSRSNRSYPSPVSPGRPWPSTIMATTPFPNGWAPWFPETRRATLQVDSVSYESDLHSCSVPKVSEQMACRRSSRSAFASRRPALARSKDSVAFPGLPTGFLPFLTTPRSDWRCPWRCTPTRSNDGSLAFFVFPFYAALWARGSICSS